MKSLGLLPGRSVSRLLVRVSPAIAAALFLAGCETTAIKNYRSHPDFHARMGEAGKRVAAPADISIQEVGAGGVSEEIDEYSEEATRMFSARLDAERDADGALLWKAIEVPESQRAEYDDAAALARVALGDMLAYAYHPTYAGFAHKRASFRYSIGDVSSLLADSDADSILFIFGIDRYTTAGRKAINGVMTVLAAAATGAVYVGTEGAGAVSALLVARDGEVLWMDHLLDLSLDLRQQADVDRVIATFLTDLNRAVADAAPAPAVAAR